LLFLDWGFPDTPPEEPAVHLIVISSVVDTYASLRHPDAYENNS
jgi:hypothetical protein